MHYNLVEIVGYIRKTIKKLNLDLNNLKVFTEAGTNAFLYTPIIATLSGAEKTYAIVKDSIHGSKESIIKNLEELKAFLGIGEEIEIVLDKAKIKECDIVTNLGFVRPIDNKTISMMKPGSVISYMAEPWELRSEDIDVRACIEKGILVMGTNEDYLNIFSYVGELAQKLIHDIGLPAMNTSIAVYGTDKFADTIENYLKGVGANVLRFDGVNFDELNSFEVLIVADYTTEQTIIGGKNAIIDVSILKQFSPFIKIIQLCGKNDVEVIKDSDLFIYPDKIMEPRRMSYTLAYLGVRPVIELHASGLKVGEIMTRYLKEYRDRLDLKTLAEKIEIENPLCKKFELTD